MHRMTSSPQPLTQPQLDELKRFARDCAKFNIPVRLSTKTGQNTLILEPAQVKPITAAQRGVISDAATQVRRNRERPRATENAGAGVPPGGKPPKKPPGSGDQPPEKNPGSQNGGTPEPAPEDWEWDDGLPVSLPQPVRPTTARPVVGNIASTAFPIKLKLAERGPFAGVTSLAQAKERVRQLIQQGRLVEPESGELNVAYNLLDESGQKTGKIVRVPRDATRQNVTADELHANSERQRLFPQAGAGIDRDQSAIFPSSETNKADAFLVIDKAPGVSLSQAMDTTPISSQQKVKYVQSIINQVADFNSEGWAHGDLNPKNIFVVPDGVNPGKVTLIDFGESANAGTARAAKSMENDIWQIINISGELKPDSVSPQDWSRWVKNTYMTRLNNPSSPANAKKLAEAERLFQQYDSIDVDR